MIENLSRKLLSSSTHCHLLKLGYRISGYRALGNPLRTYEADLSDINYKCTDKKKGIFSIRAGEWDLRRMYFKQTYRYKMFNKRFKEGYEWKGIEEYKTREEKLKESGYVGSLDIPEEEQTPEKLSDYYDYIERLYIDIKENGYKAQDQLNSSDDYAGRKIHPSLNEIQIGVGRDGTMLVLSGYHRYTIAKILEIESIPVRTQTRHVEWQRLREKIIRGEGTPEKYRNHPDLQDIL